jgi:hypothetical protein
MAVVISTTPSQASAVLTQHYNRMHPEALTGVPENQR